MNKQELISKLENEEYKVTIDENERVIILEKDNLLTRIYYQIRQIVYPQNQTTVTLCMLNILEYDFTEGRDKALEIPEWLYSLIYGDEKQLINWN